MKRETILMLLTGVYVSLLVAANAAGSKIVAIGSLAASATVFAYAFTFPITDVATELYGKRAAQKLVIFGFSGVLLSVVFFQIALHAPGAAFYNAQEAFATIFSLTPRLLAGGLLSYLVSQFLDVWLFEKIKKFTKGRYLWLRNNGSTMISQLVDSAIFITVAFYGVVDAILPIILGQYFVKLAIAAIDTPIVYLLVKLFRNGFKSNKR